MRKKMTMFVMAGILCLGSYAYAEPPKNKQAREAQEYQQGKDKGRVQNGSETYGGDRKHYEEMERDRLKHQEEMNKGDYGRHGRDYGESYDRGRHDGESHRYFTDDQRAYIQDHYVNRYHKGKKCPPGLSKKRNGCLPPGQAKKWEIGRPLARNVVFYDLPSSVREHLGPPPSRHRYVRVAQDILLIAVGTGMVVDAIDDLNWEFNR